MSVSVTTGTVYAGTNPPLAARVVNMADTPITQITVASIDYVVTSADDGTTVVAATSLTVSAVVFDTYQAWEVDAVGFNVRFQPSLLSFPTPGSYLVDLRMVMTNGDVLRHTWAVQALRNVA